MDKTIMIPKARISKGGKIVIPILIRKKLNMLEGEEVTLELQDDHIIITSLRHTLEKKAFGESRIEKLF